MVQAMIENVEDDIKTAITDSGNFSDFTLYSVENDDDEDVDFEYDVPNIIYGSEGSPVDYFMDGSRIMSTDIILQVNVDEFSTINSLTRKRLINYKLDQLQDTLNDMSFTNITPIEFNTSLGETAARVPVGEDEFIYRGSLGMSITYLDNT